MFLSRQLAATGSAVEAAALLAAIGECEQAVVLLLQHNSCREACLLAQHSDAVSPAVRRDAWLAMAAVLQTEGKHAVAAEAFACAGDISASIECLERVGTLKSIVLAGNLVVASAASHPYKTTSLLAVTVQQRQVLCALFACVVLGEEQAALAACVEDDGESRAAACECFVILPSFLLQALSLLDGKPQSKPCRVTLLQLHHSLFASCCRACAYPCPLCFIARSWSARCLHLCTYMYITYVWWCLLMPFASDRRFSRP